MCGFGAQHSNDTLLCVTLSEALTSLKPSPSANLTSAHPFTLPWTLWSVSLEGHQGCLTHLGVPQPHTCNLFYSPSTEVSGLLFFPQYLM